MTKDSQSTTAVSRGLLSESSDTQFLAEVLCFVAHRFMALNVDELCGSGAHEWGDARFNHQTGYRSRAREMRAGRVKPITGHGKGMLTARVVVMINGFAIAGSAGPADA